MHQARQTGVDGIVTVDCVGNGGDLQVGDVDPTGSPRLMHCGECGKTFVLYEQGDPQPVRDDLEALLS